MKTGILRISVSLLIAVLLAGCGDPLKKVPGTGPEPDPMEGDGTLVVSLSEGAAPQAFSLMAADEGATHVRVRVYGPGFNLIENKEISAGDPSQVALTVPAGTGYTVDAITFNPTKDNVAGLMESGRTGEVTVLAEQVTETIVPVSGYAATFAGPSEVTEGFEFTVEATIMGPNIFGGSAYFRMNETPWTNDELVGGAGIKNAKVVASTDDSITVRYTGFAPAVEETTTFYYGFLVLSKTEYYDLDRGLPALAVYAPSVDAGESLQTIKVNPL